ncbi:helix-turn-helix domain-containing protein [Aeromonas sp. MaB10011B]|uniref:Cro/CI family transcriptional regulator n=1 Tax=unclassified Aeromonas TaxID=257493 RepID=UPI001B339B64|nr:helix-turn-helix domain-containing protein [Aeromonas sp. MaB10011B]MBP4078516.1 helix-turn-helix domain-containing protein [Aeromonas sp. MrichA-1]
MKKADAINFFGSAAELARKLNISEAAVSQWGDTIPQGRAYQIEVLTGGELKADPAPTSGQQRPYQRVAPGTPLADTPSVQRATDTAQTDAPPAQPGKA